MSDKYVLRGHEVVPTNDLFEWGRMFEDNAARTVATDTLGEVYVSTVFLGADHNWGEGPPLIFETMIFRGPHDQRMWRYSTWDEAEAGHRRIVAALAAGLDPDAE